MTISTEQAQTLIHNAIAALNEDLPEAERVDPKPSTVLFGIGAEIDSLSLVSLVVDIETELSDQYNLDVELAGEEATARTVLPFSTVQALEEYILERANEST
jgi:acyl carrier protein